MQLKSKFKLLISLVIVITISAFGFYGWFVIYPRHLAQEPIAQFENAFYSGNPEDCFQALIGDSYYARKTKEHLSYVNELFLKFERGFEIVSARRFYPSNPEKAGFKNSISVHLSKIAKIDGKPRKYFDVELVNVDGQWKVLHYYFPDVINY